MVRIISGSARGRTLKVPEGQVVRPTADRVREALFNVLVHRHHIPFAGARVLDLFAGAGSLGLEAKSRGAALAWFVEQDATVAKVLAGNLATFGEGTRLILQPVARFLAGPKPAEGARFDLVFLDPPYRIGAVAPTLLALVDGWLAPGARVVIEHPADEAIVPPGGLGIHDQRIYGGTAVTVVGDAEEAL